jgi:hypothetical protein
MELPKAKSKSVSLLPSLWERVEEKALKSHEGNRSSYIRKLVERDLAETNDVPDALSSTIIEELAERLGGALLAADLRRSLQGLEQPRVLLKLLQTQACGDFSQFSPQLWVAEGTGSPEAKGELLSYPLDELTRQALNKASSGLPLTPEEKEALSRLARP